MCKASSGFFLRRAAPDLVSIIATSSMSAVIDVLGTSAAFATATWVFSGLQGREPSGRSGFGRGEPSPTNILIIGS